MPEIVERLADEADLQGRRDAIDEFNVQWDIKKRYCPHAG